MATSPREAWLKRPLLYVGRTQEATSLGKIGLRSPLSGDAELKGPLFKERRGLKGHFSSLGKKIRDAVSLVEPGLRRPLL